LKRMHNVEATVSIQREVMSNVSVTGGWFHRKYYHVPGVYNTAVDPQTDYTSFVVANPYDGTPLTIFNLKPERQGRVNLVDRTSDVNTVTYNDFEISANARLRGGVVLFGGWTMDR